MVTETESQVSLADGLSVYTKTWSPPTSPVAQIFFLHGFSDHCNAYYDLPKTIAQSGIEFFSFDQRGWGRSALDKTQWGVSGSTEQLFTDLDELLRLRLEARPSIPLFLVGHSMGGGIALTYAYSGTLRSKLAGVAVWAPLIDLAPNAKPPGFVVAAGKFASKFLPNWKRPQKMDAESMSRDEAVCKDYAEDPLCHGTGTLLGIVEMLVRAKKLMREDVVRRFLPDTPVLVCHGTADRVTDCQASRRFVEMLGVRDKEFREYKGWYHKMHAEPGEDREIFVKDIIDWTLKRTNQAKPSGGVPKL
ncbi:Alpha/Beta hydrolase protein [Pyronema omphalodes]|nr:Alpha/Beta hydrolase protein [Pyronema omphalodes]